MNTPEDFYDILVNKIGELLFGTSQAHHAYPYRTLVDAWLKQNGLGPDDLKKYFDKNTSKIKPSIAKVGETIVVTNPTIIAMYNKQYIVLDWDYTEDHPSSDYIRVFRNHYPEYGHHWVRHGDYIIIDHN